MNKSISEQLAEAIGFLRDIQKEHQYYCNKLAEAEKKELDLLHFLELNKAGYRERYKITTQLRRCLLERRACKDRVEERAPIAEFLMQPQNKSLLDKLGKVLGDVRKVERYHENRSYSPRVLECPGSQTATKIEHTNFEEDHHDE
jgi:arginine deiminase